MLNCLLWLGLKLLVLPSHVTLTQVLQNATPLFLAAKNNHAEVVEMLLDEEADAAVQCTMLYVVRVLILTASFRAYTVVHCPTIYALGSCISHCVISLRTLCQCRKYLLICTLYLGQTSSKRPYTRCGITHVLSFGLYLSHLSDEHTLIELHLIIAFSLLALSKLAKSDSGSVKLCCRAGLRCIALPTKVTQSLSLPYCSMVQTWLPRQQW